MGELETLKAENRKLKEMLAIATALLSKTKDLLAKTHRPTVRKSPNVKKKRRAPTGSQKVGRLRPVRGETKKMPASK